MKKILIVAFVAILALCGCTPKADKAAEVASDFLSDFFNMDYAGAAAFCTDDIAAMLRDTIAAGDYPSEEIRAKVVEASRKTTFKVLSSALDEESGDVVVNYEIVPYGAVKSSAIRHTMRLVRIEGDWKITSLE